ncbi:MAG: hypothetical protein ACRC62_01290 [Microcoleus sp.]
MKFAKDLKNENQLISKVAIELAIAASKTCPTRYRLDYDDFRPGFDAIEASKMDMSFVVYVEAAKAIIETVLESIDA